tara:strand:+ start:148 stop:501 length:354 start_codon:yes stop_codon:yes gene_type:complete
MKNTYTKIKEILKKYGLKHKITIDGEFINKRDIFKFNYMGYIVIYKKGSNWFNDQLGYIVFNNEYNKTDISWISDYSLNNNEYVKEVENLYCNPIEWNEELIMRNADTLCPKVKSKK